jgi:hypothetical protein
MIEIAESNQQIKQNWFQFDTESISGNDEPVSNKTLKKLQSIVIKVSVFSLELKLNVIEVDLISKVIKTKLFNEVKVNICYDTKNDNLFKLSNFEVNPTEKPISVFIAKTLNLIMSLTNVTFQIGEKKFDCEFRGSVKEITSDLQLRQIAYRIMVIERAFGLLLFLKSEYLKPEEILQINYCYHSIVDRKFEFVADSKYDIGENETKNIVWKLFGREIDLAVQKIRIIKLGVMQVESITTPFLPKNAFDKDIQQLIDLEAKLVDAMFEKHITTFSNAFEGLSDKQIEVLTERPTLEEEAFNF